MSLNCRRHKCLPPYALANTYSTTVATVDVAITRAYRALFVLQLIPFLESIATAPDVRPMVRDEFKLHERVARAS